MWRDDGTRSAVKQSYRKGDGAQPRDPQLAVIPVPRQAAEPQARGGMGWEGLGRWCLHDPPCSVVNLLFHVLGGAILITNYIMHAPLARKSL